MTLPTSGVQVAQLELDEPARTPRAIKPVAANQKVWNRSHGLRNRSDQQAFALGEPSVAIHRARCTSLNQRVATKGSPEMTNSPTRGVTSSTLCSSAAFITRSIGSSQSWIAILNVAQ
jgi:hypothetical protein